MNRQEGTSVIPADIDGLPALGFARAPTADEQKPVLTEHCMRAGEVLSHIGDKWGVMIVMLLQGGPRRFNALKGMIGGVSQRMLSRTLRRLERDGLVTRTVFDFVPPRVEYELTPLGQSMCRPLAVLSRWVFDNLDAIDTARQAFDRREEKR